MASNYYDPWGPTDTGGEGMSPLEWEEYLRRKRQLDFLKQYAAEPTPLGELSPPEQTTVGETPEQRLERLRKPLPGLETVGWESPGVERTFAPLDPLARTIARGGAGAAGKLWEGAVAWPIKFAQRHGVGFSTSEEGPSPEEREAELAKKKMYAEAEKIEKGITPEENDVFNTIKEYAEGRALKAKQVQEQMGPPGGVGEELLGGVISATGDVLPINLWGKAKLAMGPYMGLKAYAEGKSPAEAFGEGLVGQAIGMVLKAGGQLTGEYGPRVLQELPKIAKEFVSPVAGAVIGGAPVFVEQLLAGKSVRDAWRAAIEPAVTFGALATPGKARPLERMLLPEGAPKPSEIPLSPESVEAARRAGVNPEVFFDRKLPEVGPSPAEVEVAKYGEPTVARPPEALGPPTETPTAVKPAEPRVEFPELAIKPKEYTYKFNTLPIDPNIKITRDPQGGGQLAYEKSGKDVGYLDFDPSPDGRGFFIRSIDSSAKGEGVGTALWKAAAQLTNGPRRGGRGVLSFQDKDAVTREMGGQQFAKSMERRFPELVDSEELTSDIKRMEKIKQQAGLTTEYGLEENKPGGVNVRPAVLPSGDVGAGRGAPEAGGVGPSVRPAVGELGPRGSGGVEGRRGAVGEAPAPPEAERPELAPGDRVTYPNQITGKSEGGVVNPAGTLITLDGGGVRPIAAAVAAGARRVAPPVAPEAPQAATPRPEGYTAPTVTEAPPEAPVVAPAAPAPAPVTPEARPRARKPGPVVGPTETLLRELWDSGVKMPRRGESMWEELAGPRNKGGAIPPMMRRTGKGVRGQNYDMWLRRAVELGVLPEGADVSDLVRIARSPMSEAKRIDAQLRGERPDLTAQEQVEFDRAMEDAATRWTERFPEMGGKITKTGVGLQIQLKSGNKILVQENVPEIPVEAEAETKYREIHPEIAETTRLRAHGKTMRIGPNALIQIAKNAEDGTDVHEVTHVAYDMGVVTRAEDSVLGNKYAKGVADPVARQEAIADGVAVEATPKFLRRFTARVLSLGEMLQNAAARVGLAKEAVPSERRVLTDLRSGRVLRRPGPAPGAEEKFALKSEERPSWEDELKSVGGKIDPDGTVLLYHATTKGGAQEILRTGLLRRPPDAPDSYGVYFSSSREVASDYGDGTIVPVRVRATDLSPDDVFPGRRLDFSAKTSAGIYRPVSVGEEAKAKFALKPEEERRLEVIGVAPWQRTRADFEAGVSVHGANIPRGSDVEYVEPRIGEFTRTMYAGAGEGTFEEMGGKELAYFRPPGDVRSIEKYAEGVAVFPKKGEPYILVTDKPNDALFVRKDGLYDSGGNLVSRDTGLGPEPGDIISESGAAVLYKIPLGRWRESGAGGIHEYFVREALKLGKPVPPEVLAEYPGLRPAEAQPKFKLTPEEEKQAAAIEGVEPEGAAAAREKYRAGERRRERGGFSEPTTTVETAGKVAAAAEAGVPRGGKPPEEYLNLSKITDEKSAQAAFEALIDANPGRFESTSRPVTWEEVAKQSGLLTNSDVKRIVEEHGYVSAKIIVKSSEAARATAPVLIEAAQRLEKARLEGKGLDDAENNWLEVSQKSLGLLATAKEARTEAGRALNIAKRVSQGMTKRDVLLEHLLDKTADPRVIAELAKMDPNNPDPVLVHDLLRAANRPLVTDMIQEAALSFMMSGIKTVERNLGGNSIFQALKLPVKVVSSALDAIYVGAKGGGTERQRYFAEIAKETRMLKDGLPQAWLEAVDAFQERGAVNWGRIEATHLPAIPGTTGKIIRIPLRNAGMGDAFFGSLASQQEIAAQAYRRAKNDVKAGKAKNLEARMAEILKHIDDYPQILRAAKKERAYRTFQEELGPFGQKVMGLLNHNFPLVGKLPRLIVAPFVKTPTNLFKVAVEHSPIGFAYSLLKTGLGGRARGLKAYEDRGEVTDQMAKGIVGSMIAGVIYAMVKDGTITGMGPKDPKKKANKMATGWQPYAFRVADQFLSFQGWEPLSGMIMQVANFDQAVNEKDKDKRLGEIFRAAREVAVNKTSAVGFQNLTLAQADPERWAKRYLQSIAGMPIPTILSHVTQALDPYVRRRDTFWDVIRSRVPGLSEDLEGRYTVTGKEVKREQTPLETVIAPYTRTTEKPAPLERELDRLGYVPVYAPRKVVINKKDYELTQEQMQFYVEADKKAAAEALNTIKKRYYQGAPEEPTPGMKTKQEILRDIWAHERALARMRVVREVYRGGR